MLDIATVLTTIFTYVDEYCKSHSSEKPGPTPKLTDSEIITIAIFCELMGKTSEYAHTRCVIHWLQHYFPRMIDRSRYHRRLKGLTKLINDVREAALPDIGTFLIHILDSTPVPVLSFKRAGFTPLFPEASYGHCAAKSMTYYGFKLHLVTDVNGVPIYFDITPAHVSDVSIAGELLEKSSKSATVLADKGYISKELADMLLSSNNIDLWTPKRKNQSDREPRSERKYLSKLRQKIEIVNGILKEQFHLEHTLSKSLLGLVHRIVRKLAAFTFGILINKLNGRELLRVTSLVN